MVCVVFFVRSTLDDCKISFRLCARLRGCLTRTNCICWTCPRTNLWPMFAHTKRQVPLSSHDCVMEVYQRIFHLNKGWLFNFVICSICKCYATTSWQNIRKRTDNFQWHRCTAKKLISLVDLSFMLQATAEDQTSRVWSTSKIRTHFRALWFSDKEKSWREVSRCVR